MKGLLWRTEIFTWNDKVMSWYGANAQNQLNVSGRTYKVVALYAMD